MARQFIQLDRVFIYGQNRLSIEARGLLKLPGMIKTSIMRTEGPLNQRVQAEAHRQGDVALIDSNNPSWAMEAAKTLLK